MAKKQAARARISEAAARRHIETKASSAAWHQRKRHQYQRKKKNSISISSEKQQRHGVSIKQASANETWRSINARAHYQYQRSGGKRNQRNQYQQQQRGMAASRLPSAWRNGIMAAK